MARIETIPKPVCEREGCDRAASVQVVANAGQVFGRFCSGHGMSALLQAEGKTPKPKAEKEAASR